MRLQKVIEAFQRLDRRAVASLVAEELRESPAAGGDHWANVEGVANRIGEIELALEAARRYALTEPRTLDRALHYCHALAARGRIDTSLREIDALPPHAQRHPEVLALRGSLAMRTGDLVRAAELARQAVAQTPNNGRYWWALAMVHKFSPADADLERMQALLPVVAEWPAPSRASFPCSTQCARATPN
jgi:tetratricopeptide (TPR) repeat protein